MDNLLSIGTVLFHKENCSNDEPTIKEAVVVDITDNKRIKIQFSALDGDHGEMLLQLNQLGEHLFFKREDTMLSIADLALDNKYIRYGNKKIENYIQAMEADKKRTANLASSNKNITEGLTISDYLKKRKVNYFVHFTPVENVPNIVEKGLSSRAEQISRGEKNCWPDNERMDRMLTHSSLSISFPNYKLLYNKSQSSDYHYAILLVSSQIVEDYNEGRFLFFKSNAASEEFIGSWQAHRGVKALNELFSDHAIYNGRKIERKELHLPDNYTTNPQAEVLVYGTLSPKYIKQICVKDLFDYNCLCEDLYKKNIKIPCVISKELFGYRKDWESWMKG